MFLSSATTTVGRASFPNNPRKWSSTRQSDLQNDSTNDGLKRTLLERQKCFRILNNRGLAFGTAVETTTEEIVYLLGTPFNYRSELSDPNIESSYSRSSSTSFFPTLRSILSGDG